MATLKKKKDFKSITLQLKELEKEQTKPKANRKKEILKLRAEINETETKKTVEKINKIKS